MKKANIYSIILSIVLVLIMVFTLVACGEDECSHKDADNNNVCDDCGETLSQATPTETYTVTLLDDDFNPVEGASIQIRVNGANKEVKVTDANGKVTFDVITGAVLVQAGIIDVPAEYSVKDGFELVGFEGNKELRIVGVIKNETYTVKVVDQDGNAVEGVQLQLCFGETCMTNKPYTNTDGIASWMVDGSLYSVDTAYVSINKLPNEYELKEGEILNDTLNANFTHYTGFNSDFTLEIEIEKIDPVTVTASDLFSNKVADVRIKLYDAKDKTLVGEAITDADGKAVFVIQKEISYKSGSETLYNYYITAEHKDKDPRYVWSYREEGYQDLTSKDMLTNVYVNEFVMYNVNVSRTNTDLSLEGIRVSFLNRLFEEVMFGTTDQTGAASFVNQFGEVVTYAPLDYDTYFIRLENIGGGFAPLYKVEKDGTIVHNIEINDDDVLGSENTPVDLVYGYNNLPALSLNNSVYVKVINPQGAILKIDNNVLVSDGTQSYWDKEGDGYVSVQLGANDQVFRIEARENLGYWGAEIFKDGIPGHNVVIKESELDSDISVNLTNGRFYYTFVADESTATLNLSGEGLRFEIDGMDVSKAVLAKDEEVSFAVVGEGQATFSISYAPAFTDYIVNVSEEIVAIGNVPLSGAIVQLIYEGTAIREGETNADGVVIFKGVQEYPVSKIKADFKELPQGYVRFYENVDGYYFGEEEGVYSTACALTLVRDGTQELPYFWTEEGRSKAPTYTVTIPEGGNLFVEGNWVNSDIDAPKNYVVFLKGDYSSSIVFYNFNTDLDAFNFNNPQPGKRKYDATLDATIIEIPLNRTICLKIVGEEGTTIKLRWGTEALDLTAGDPIATGTEDNPFTLTFAQTITTPDFVQGTSLDNPGVSVYYYSYTAPTAMTIMVINTDADISVFVNGDYTDISNGSFAVEQGDVISIEVRSAKEVGDDNALAGVSFAVKGI